MRLSVMLPVCCCALAALRAIAGSLPSCLRSKALRPGGRPGIVPGPLCLPPGGQEARRDREGEEDELCHGAPASVWASGMITAAGSAARRLTQNAVRNFW